MSQDDWVSLVKQWFPHLTDTRLRQVTWPEFAKHHDYIVEMLRARVTKTTIHQRLRDEQGVAGSLASFKRRPTRPRRSHDMTNPQPDFDIPQRAEREQLNAALHTTDTETGFWDDNGRPAPWPDDIEHWTTDTHEAPPAEPGQPPF